MQDIHLIVHDPQLEQALLRLAKQHQQNLQDFVMTVLARYIQENEPVASLNIQKLDPLQHSQAPTQAFEMMESGLVFSDIDDSVDFAKKLRQQAWQRHE